MVSTVMASVLFAYLLFSFPGSDAWAHQPLCINENKWHSTMSHQTAFLGFDIGTCFMHITWPLDKRIRLCQCIQEIIMTTQGNGFVSCHLIAQALGLLHNGCAVLPLGAMLSLQIQHAFNDCIKAHMQKGSSIWHQQVFWDSTEICLTNHLQHDFKALRTLLTTDGTSPTIWTRPIRLLIPHKSKFTFFSNASHEGLGAGAHSFI